MRLVELLDDDATDVAEDAKAALMALGAPVVGPLMAAVPTMRRYGQLCAIEVFEHHGDPAAGPVLIELLGSEYETVREWSAWALADLDVRRAVPALQAADRRRRGTDDGPDCSEAVAIRHALTVLGARRAVLPPVTGALSVSAPGLERAWPAVRLQEVITEMADYRQAVLFFQVWQVTDRGAFWQHHDRIDQKVDWNGPWPAIVQATREAALLEAACVPPRDDLVATMEWIDEADR